MSPGGAIFVPSPPKAGTNLRHPRPPQSLNDSRTSVGAEADVNWPAHRLDNKDCTTGRMAGVESSLWPDLRARAKEVEK